MNKKVFSRTSTCGMKVMFAALQILSEKDGLCRLADLRSAIAQRVKLSPWDVELVNGSPRWSFSSPIIPPPIQWPGSFGSLGAPGI